MRTLALTADEIETWLRLVNAPALGPRTVRRLMAAFGLPQHIFEQSHAALVHAVGEKKADAVLQARDSNHRNADSDYARAIEWALAPNHHFVTLADPAYPHTLLQMTDPPPVLYVQGQIECLHAPSIAIVGSRHGSAQGLQNTTQFARAFSDAGFCIVSGLALGIDGAAHRGGLEGRASTLAVIGTGIDLVYPTRHHRLAQKITVTGAIVSEWPLGAPPRPAHFPQRNRLIAGLAQGVLVVEAAAQSGSLITARLAAEMGREVFALPGSIHSPLSKGCHQLIKEGAKLVESIQDVLDELQPMQAQPAVAHRALQASRKTPSVACVEKQTPFALSMGNAGTAPRRILEALGYDPISLDALIARTGLNSAELQAMLLTLEMEGKIALLPGSRVIRLPPHGGL